MSLKSPFSEIAKICMSLQYACSGVTRKLNIMYACSGLAKKIYACSEMGVVAKKKTCSNVADNI